MKPESAGPVPDAEEQGRADLYGLLSVLLARPPDAARLELVAGLGGDETALGQALAALAADARNREPAGLEHEHHMLFVGLGRGELLPYGSYYLTGFLHEKPLAVLRNDFAELGLGRAESVREPEDHIASLCEAMRSLIRGDHCPRQELGRQKAFFERHISPWAPHFFVDLQGAKHAGFYAGVGAVGAAFLAIETEAFRMVAPE